MCKILLFAGTTEGRILAEYLQQCNRAEVFASIATEYGEALLKDHDGIRLLCGRLTVSEMEDLLQRECFDLVLDATHPYAVQVSENIKAACNQQGTPLLRILRESGADDNCILAENTREAVRFLQTTEGTVLLTTGSKELEEFTLLPNFKQRLYVRVLPAKESMEHCLQLGIPASHIIAMQGPFSEELNLAMLRQIGAKWLVSKNSGKNGGFLEKQRAAQKAGAGFLVIGRPTSEQGVALEEVKQILKEKFGLCSQSTKAEEKEGYFPFFISLTGKPVTVVGGGKIATRRVVTLLQFGADVTVICPEKTEQLQQLENKGSLKIITRRYQAGDCDGATFVVTATDDRSVNHQIYLECKQNGIPINVADCPEESDFYFPGIAKKNGLVIGVTASGMDHRLARLASEKARKMIEEICQEEKSDA